MLQSANIAVLAINFATATPIESSTSVSQPETAAGNFTIQESGCFNFVDGAVESNCRWCADYLQGLGSTACVVDRRSGYPPKFCAHGSDPSKCYVYGVLPDGIDYSSSAWYVYSAYEIG
jgi:hypothetical protein